MTIKTCLNFQQIFNYIQNKYSINELNQIQEHIQNCSDCADEFKFIQKICDSLTLEKKKSLASLIYEEEPHISEEVKEQFFQGTLAQNRMEGVKNHLKKCSVCRVEFDAIYTASQPKISPKDAALLKQIESAKIQDRMSSFKQHFILPKKERAGSLFDKIRMALDKAWLHWPAVPKFAVVTIALLCLFIPLYYGYRSYMISNTIQQAETAFSLLQESIKIKDGELRPAGGFQYSYIGTLRSDSTQVSDTLSSALVFKALEFKPDNSRLNHFLGTIYYFGGRMEKAEEYYLKALALDEKNAKIYNDLALIDVHRRDFQRAAERLHQAIILDNSLLEAHYNLAVVYELMGSREKAMAVWENYIELDIDEHSDWKNVARSHLQKLQN